MIRRTSGILLHITSLPSPYGIGDLGPGAYAFADFLLKTGQSFWQILPLNPTDTALGNSPYSSFSAFAGNPLLISPDLLVEEGFLTKSEIGELPVFPKDRVDYEAVSEYKANLLGSAYEKNRKSIEKNKAFAEFCQDHHSWLDDYALFVALKKHFKGLVWSAWPKEVRDRREKNLEKYRKILKKEVLMEKFFQHLFYGQWLAMKKRCNAANIRIIGDMPIYVNYDSTDVWANPGLFKLDEEKKPTHVAGVPPDYFSATGQLWGNPVYRWNVLEETHYRWWMERMEHNLRLFDRIRLDHFRGFIAYWEVPAEEQTAVNGTWIEVPAQSFFQTLSRRFPYLPLIAEDLGIITPDVREMMRTLGFPGMKVLLFAFSEDFASNPYIPHRIIPNSIVYTGTHDNNTTRGWFRKEAGPEERERFFRYVGREVNEEECSWEMIRLAMMSVGNTVIIPMQDLLGLGEEARMNRPATGSGNWAWRFRSEQLTPVLSERLLEMTETYGRT